MENMSVKRVIRQISFPGQGSDSSPSKSSSPGGNIPAAPFRFPDSSSTGGSASSHTAPGNCNCQPMVVCISQAYKGLQSCQFPDGNSGVCCPAESPTNSSPNQGAVNDRLFYLLSLFQKPIQYHKANTSRKDKKPSHINMNLSSISQQQYNSASQMANQIINNHKQLKNERIKQAIVVKSGTPASSHRHVFKISTRSKKIHEDAIAILEASKALIISNQLSPNELRQVSLQQTPLANRCQPSLRCDYTNSKYRTADGSCNNLQHTSWGRAGMPFQRITPSIYDDGMSSPRTRATDGSELPNVREVANIVLVDQDFPDLQFTVSLMQWAQFVDHDIAHTTFDTLQCCPVQNQLDECFPITVSSNDGFFGPLNQRCINFVRSMLAIDENCSMGSREQQNIITSFLDGSNIYGSNGEELNNLRSNRDGLLRNSSNNMLPIAPPGEECEAEKRGAHCVVAGDSRVNEQPGLTAIHTVFMREHNRVASELKRLNPSWSDDALFQEARRIVIAEYQHITYNEWLPIILGSDYMSSFDMNTRQNGLSFDYSPNINPSITNEFATAAFRFGHSLVPGVFKLISERGAVSTIKLRDHFFSPHLITGTPSKLDDIIRWMFHVPGQQLDNFVSSDLTNHLFQTATTNFGMDLMALNIQRGRDHGLATYGDLRDICGLQRAKSFDDIPDHQISQQIVQRLRQVYRSVDDIDLFVGGLAERPRRGTLLGPTFLCIIGDQFARLKKGDRYFYDLGGQAGSFSEGQLQEIRRASWARIMCDNGETVRNVQPLAFWLPNSQRNQLVDCNSNYQIPRVNLNLWRNEWPQA